MYKGIRKLPNLIREYILKPATNDFYKASKTLEQIPTLDKKTNEYRKRNKLENAISTSYCTTTGMICDLGSTSLVVAGLYEALINKNLSAGMPLITHGIAMKITGNFTGKKINSLIEILNEDVKETQKAKSEHEEFMEQHKKNMVELREERKKLEQEIAEQRETMLEETKKMQEELDELLKNRTNLVPGPCTYKA